MRFKWDCLKKYRGEEEDEDIFFWQGAIYMRGESKKEKIALRLILFLPPSQRLQMSDLSSGV